MKVDQTKLEKSRLKGDFEQYQEEVHSSNRNIKQVAKKFKRESLNGGDSNNRKLMFYSGINFVLCS